ncbi:MAG: NUDIX hydrolase [Calditrichaceae bacterium]|nr:NUDIX hydrolase [Calditrichaceae bacterium]MBN2710064.1 NUDIX hydrolase [Calditrichaceae bacterium]RQV94520.1 MAG: NUDIX domain-containing protein [Calditrichota bacterium]
MKKEFPVIGVGAVVIHKNKILLVKRKNPPSMGLWAIPGGKVNSGEKMKDAVERETIEETGIKIKCGEIIHVFEVIEYEKQDKLKFHYIIVDFLAEYLSGNVISGDDAEDAGWFSAQELTSMRLNEEMIKLLKEKLHFYQ